MVRQTAKLITLCCAAQNLHRTGCATWGTDTRTYEAEGCAVLADWRVTTSWATSSDDGPDGYPDLVLGADNVNQVFVFPMVLTESGGAVLAEWELVLVVQP